MKKGAKIGIALIVIAVVAIGVFFLVNANRSPQQVQASQSPVTASAALSEAPSPTVTLIPSSLLTPSPTLSPTSSATASVKTAEDPVSYKDNKIQYSYYDVNSDSKKSVTVDTDSTSKLNMVLAQVAKSYYSRDLADTPLDPNSIKLQGDSVYIDLKSSLTMGAESEASLLNTIVSAYKSNIEGVNNVYFSVNGQDYSSGNMSFSKDKPYSAQ
jgi:Sporulation and spore germination.